jgi:hypothetical protein
LQYSFSGNRPTTAAPLVAGRAIKFTTDPPNHTTANPGSGDAGAAFSFGSPAPNPANPGTVLTFALPYAGHTRVDLYDVMGRRVASLLDKDLAAGRHNLQVDGSAMANGIYFAVLRFEGQSLTRKILILK